MKIIHDIKKYKKFEKDSNRNPAIGMKFKYFCMYVQLAEACENGYHLSQQPWKWRKFHKLTGNRSNEYSFGISKTDRTTCYGNDRKTLSLNEVTEIEIKNYIEDYH